VVQASRLRSGMCSSLPSAAPARERPATVAPNVGSASADRLFDDPINFGEHQWDHSAEFNGTNAVRRYYCNMLMKKMSLTPWTDLFPGG
jgi:hypothetical protein